MTILKKKSLDTFKYAIKNNVVHKIDGKNFYEWAAYPGVGWLEDYKEKAHDNGYLTRTIKKENGMSIILIRRK